jgi:hypothetical protein
MHYVSKYDKNDPNGPISEEDAIISTGLCKHFRLNHSESCACEDCCKYRDFAKIAVNGEMAERKRRGMSNVFGAAE